MKRNTENSTKADDLATYRSMMYSTHRTYMIYKRTYIISKITDRVLRQKPAS